MMLDAKQTFDELVARLAPDAAARDDVLAEPHLPAALERGRRLAGVHGRREALRARPLGALRRARARHAAVAQRARLPRRARPPHRLPRGPRAEGVPRADRPRREGRRRRHERRVLRAAAADGRRPARRPRRLLPRARRASIDGFKERAEGVKALLGDPATTFLIVTSPEREPVEEAIFFRGKLADHDMPFGGLVVNRAHALDGTADDADAAGAGGRARRPARGEGRARVRRGAGRSPSATRPRSSGCARRPATPTRSSCRSSRATSTTSTGSSPSTVTCSRPR